MASVGSSGSQINHNYATQLARGDGAIAANLRAQSGVTGAQAQGARREKKGVRDDASGLSEAARQALKSDQANHADHTAQHGQEMAQQVGINTEHDSGGTDGLRRREGSDREQARLAETPEGHVKVTNPKTGADQVIPKEDHAHLQRMDDPDHTDRRVLDDIPPANLEAADKVMETQLAKGLSSVAPMKYDPKVDEVAGEMLVEPSPMLNKPMDIVGPGLDKTTRPALMEITPEMERMAAQQAAEDLRNGRGPEEAMMIGGGSMAMGAAASNSLASAATATSTPAPKSPALEEAEATTARRDASIAKLHAGPIGELSQRDGFEAISNASWDRFNQAYTKLPKPAQEAVSDQITVVASDWSKAPGNADRLSRMTPEQQGELKGLWQAQAAQNYANSKGAEGDPADLKHLGDGARQYIESRQAFLSHSAAATETAKPAEAPKSAALQEAEATTARRDASLERLKAGEVKDVNPRDGFEALSNASWDRFNEAYTKLPEGAQKGIQDQLVVVASDWSKKPGNQARFERMNDEQKSELKSSWHAIAAQNYGHSKDAQGDPADLTNLRDGARQYLASREGFLTSAPVAAAATVAAAAAAKPEVKSAALQEAEATTARRDTSLARLKAGEVKDVDPKAGYEALSEASWNRFNEAYNKLPEAAQKGVQDQFQVVTSDWSKKPGNSERFGKMNEDQQTELKSMWQAQAAQNYANSKDAQGDKADLTNLRDGARQYIDSREALISHNVAQAGETKAPPPSNQPSAQGEKPHLGYKQGPNDEVHLEFQNGMRVEAGPYGTRVYNAEGEPVKYQEREHRGTPMLVFQDAGGNTYWMSRQDGSTSISSPDQKATQFVSPHGPSSAFIEHEGKQVQVDLGSHSQKAQIRNADGSMAEVALPLAAAAAGAAAGATAAQASAKASGAQAHAKVKSTPNELEMDFRNGIRLERNGNDVKVTGPDGKPIPVHTQMHRGEPMYSFLDPQGNRFWVGGHQADTMIESKDKNVRQQFMPDGSSITTVFHNGQWQRIQMPPGTESINLRNADGTTRSIPIPMAPGVQRAQHTNEPGQPQQPVKTSLIDRLRYLFSGDDRHIKGNAGPNPQGPPSPPPHHQHMGGFPNHHWGGHPHHNPHGMGHWGQPGSGMPGMPPGGDPLGGMGKLMTITMVAQAIIPMAMFFSMMFR